MRSRPARLTLSVLAWMALGAAAYVTVHGQQAIDQRRSALRSFESTARDVTDALGDAQAGQQAYVAAGQDPQVWTGKVATFLQNAGSSLDSLRATALSTAAGPALLDASTAVTELRTIDRRAHDQVDAGDAQAASLTLFSAAADAASTATSNVDLALGAERQSADDFETRQRATIRYAGAGAAGFAALALLLLALARPRAAASGEPADDQSVEDTAGASSLSGLSHTVPLPATVVTPRAAEATPQPAAAEVPSLAPLAEMCTGFGRVRDAGDLNGLLAQAADLMNARGVVVWLGSHAGADLRPVLAHGYSEATLARLPTLTRTAENAAATAYRTGQVQTVSSRPGASQGAIVAPLLAAEGCIGSLTAEIRDGGETRESTRALAVILAAQLAGVLAAAADIADTGGTQAATR